MIARRHFIALGAGLLGSPFAVAGGSDGAPLVINAASDGDDRHWVIGFSTADGTVEERFRHELPARAHHIAIHEGLGLFVVLARRPGRYLWVGDLATGDPLGEFTTPADRHLYGHGVFSADGRNFWTTENAWQLVNGDSGRVVAWTAGRRGDRATFERTAEFPSYGVGPHELLLLPDQQTLVIANGGIRTHPERDREKLNLESMQPSLVYMDATGGLLLEQHVLDPDWHKASIRHLDHNADGLVVLAMQYEGEPFDRVPLLALHRRGEPLQPLWAPEPEQGQMTQYVGAVRFDASGRYFAASCPRGNMITFWDAGAGEMVQAVRSRDGCAVGAFDDGFLYTTGTGRISYFDMAAGSITDLDTAATGKVFWDNHLSLAGA